MFRLWCKIFDSNNHMLKDTVIEDNEETNRTAKVFNGIRRACYEFDLGEPIWLDANIAEFKRHSKVRFRQDNFIEQIEFEFMEIQIIEED